MDDSPECTGIFRMKKTYNELMASGQEDSLITRLRFDGPDPKRARFNHSSKSTTSLSMARLLEKEQEDRMKEADLIRARARITELESEVVNMKTNKHKAVIDLEEQLQEVKIDWETDKRKLDDLRTKLKFVARSEEELKKEVHELRKAANTLKHECEAKLLALQKEKFEKESENNQKEETVRQSLSRLRTEKCRTEAELKICQSELEEANDRADTLQRKVNELLADKNELETLRIKAMNAEQKAGDLQRELNNYHDDTVVVRAMKDKITEHADVQRENRKLRDEIDTLKRSADNSLLKDEELLSAKQKLEYMEQVRQERARVEVDNEQLTRRLAEWEAAAGSKQPKSLSDYSRQVSELQSRIAVMLEKQGQLQTSLNSAERSRQAAVDELAVFKSRAAGDGEKTTDKEDYIRRLKQRMLLLVKERDGYRKTLDSLDSDMTSVQSRLSVQRVQTLEQTVREYAQHAEQLEQKIREREDEVQAWIKKAEPSLLPARGSRPEDVAELERLRARVEEMEIYMEHRNMKGDYDPTKTKVLHMRLNPAAMARQERQESVKALREENDRLRQVVRALEEQGNGREAARIVGVAQEQLPGTSGASTKELEDTKKELSSAELKNKRLMEMFSKTSREYREIYYMLTGYKVTVNNHNVKVMSMYSEGPDDYLMFQYQNNTLNLLENEYTASLSELAQQYLLQHGSIPAFLSALTLDLFSRQTIMLS